MPPLIVRWPRLTFVSDGKPLRRFDIRSKGWKVLEVFFLGHNVLHHLSRHPIICIKTDLQEDSGALAALYADRSKMSVEGGSELPQTTGCVRLAS